MESLIIGLLGIFCPYLKAMAAKTGSPIDDMIVNIICMAVTSTPQPTQPDTKTKP